LLADAAEIVDGDDAGVRQPRHRPTLALEAPQRRTVVEPAADENLDRDRALQAQVRGPVDRAHAAAADAPLEPVLAVDDLLDGQTELEPRAVVGAALGGGGLDAEAADRAFAQGVQARQRRARDPLLVGDPVAQRPRLERVADLRADRAEEAAVADAVGLARF